MSTSHTMGDDEFLSFIATTSTRGGTTYNLKTSNCSKQAREILANTQYSALAKAHINANIKAAYYNNAEFATKLADVMREYNITLVA